MIHFRLKQEVGYLNQVVGSPTDALRFLIQIRGLGLGLSYNLKDTDGILWAKSLKEYCEAIKYLNLRFPTYDA